MRKFGKKKLIVAGVATAVIAAGAGTALAYWTTTGSGTGTATTGSDAGFTVDVTAPTGLVLDTPQDVSVKITNNAAFKQQLNAIHLSVTGIKDSHGTAITDTTVCNPAWYQLTDPSVSSHELAANGDETDTGSVTLANDPNVNQDGCKGASVDIRADAS